MEDLFNVNPSLGTPTDSQRVVNPNVFNPSPKKAVKFGNVYRATLRFLPNPNDPVNGSIISKYTAYIENYATHQKRTVEVIQGDGITETFFALKNASTAILQDRASSFSRKAKFYAYCQILSCECEPELVGKIMIWPFPQQIKMKLDQEEHPSNSMIRGHNCMNVLDSRPFSISVKLKGGYSNYEDCAFFESSDPACCVQCPIQTANGLQYIPINKQTVEQPGVADAFRAWMATAPSIEEFKPLGYHTDEERNFIIEAIRVAMDPNSGNTINSGAMNAPVFGQAPAAKPIVDSFGLNSGPVNAQPAPQAAPSMPQFTASPSAVPQATTPGGFAASNVPDLSDVLGGVSSPTQQAAPAPSPVPGGGLQLGDVLGEII